MKTADELGLTQDELEALQTVWDGLASGAYRHVKNPEITRGMSHKPVFNMDKACRTEYACGTAACIGGWMGITMGLSPSAADDYVFSKDDDLDPIHALFYPRVIDKWENLTPAHAAKAIDNFLRTGKPEWSEVAPDLVQQSY